MEKVCMTRSGQKIPFSSPEMIPRNGAYTSLPNQNIYALKTDYVVKVSKISSMDHGKKKR